MPDRLDLSGRSILLAEDEFMIALSIRVDLEERGGEVTVVDSVADGLPLVSHGFDVAVLDVRLADGEVYPLADALRQEGVRIVFHSGHAKPEDLTSRYPDSLALPKPSWGNDLVETVSRALGA